MKTINDYAELVKAEHALNKTIAPVEDGANIAGSYTSGKQFIRGGVLYTALTTIAANTAWSSLTLDTDYELADDITSQLASLNQTLTNKTDGIVANINANGSKNICPFDAYNQTLFGIAFAVNNDLSVTANGTGTASPISFPMATNLAAKKVFETGKSYVLSGVPNNANCAIRIATTGGGALWEINSSTPTVSFTYNNEVVDAVYLMVRNNATVNDVVFKPMICLASDYDLSSDYVPPTKTNRQLTEDSVDWDDMSKLGAVNYYTYSDQSGTYAGISMTRNADDSFNLAAGTTTQQLLIPSSAEQAIKQAQLLEASKSYKFSIGNVIPNCRLDVYYRATSSDSWSLIARSTTESELIFTVPSGITSTGGIWARITIEQGVTISSATVYPMITPVDYNGDYVPYAKTNRELTEDVGDISDYLESLKGYTLSDFNAKPANVPFVNYVGNASEWENPITDAGTQGGALVWLGRYDNTAVRLSQLFLCNTSDIYIRQINASSINGTWTYSSWKKITASSI